MRLQVVVAMAIAIALLLVPAIGVPAPLLVWNASPSVPIGLYAVARISPRPGDLAVVRLPVGVAMLASGRSYLPRSAYLLKPIVAAAGDQVCRHSNLILVNGRFTALAQWADRIGRSLPVWQGCHMLATDEFFLLADNPDSFDSRYFGILTHQHIVGRSFLVW